MAQLNDVGIIYIEIGDGGCVAQQMWKTAHC